MKRTTMKQRTIIPSLIHCVLPFVAISPAYADTTTQPQSLPDRVQSIFATHCAECHGESLAHPRGNFGYITNLARLAADTDLVTPGKPDQSPLWQMIKSGEMPARGAKSTPLSTDEK